MCNETLNIRVFIGKVSRWRLRKYMIVFTREGMAYDYNKRRFSMLISNDNMGKHTIRCIQHKAKRYHLQTEVINSKFIRSSSYRNLFFSSNTPDVGKYYFCIYCGKLLRADRVSVDHIIPVRKAETSRAIQILMDWLHWNGVNDVKNLGASCRQCNSRKKAKMGIWMIRGFIGRSRWFQIVRWIVRFGIILAGINMIIVYRW